jgi:phosphoribosylanthranilate isomerase
VGVDVKICGLTRPADAAAAAASGARWLGVVFAGGPRCVTVERARAVVTAAHGRPVLGVFGRQTVEEILRARDGAGLAGAQLHGPYAARDAVRLRAEGLLVWRVARLADEAGLDALAVASEEADMLLVEPRVLHADGGAGVPLPLALAAAARARLVGRRMALAGGLTAETVAAAVGLVGPDVVDVSSGVEIQPGIKDPDKMERFVEAAGGHRPPV